MKSILCVAALGWFCTAALAQEKPAEEVFKNITALKGTPSDQVVPAMQFMSSALGVECTFCHVQGKVEADDKPQKKTAREMIAMTNGINKDSFHGQKQVSCYSCHHGLSHPASVPPVLDSDPKQVTEPTPSAAPVALKPEDIVTKYIAALGGEEAIRKVNSRVLKGTILAGGRETPIELMTKAPNKRISNSSGSLTAFDGTAGWMGNTGRPARTMTLAESWAASLDAEFYLALRLKDLFPQMRLGRPEVVNGAMCETLIGTAPGHPPVRLYFDANTGLLARLIRYAETPVGRNATQIDYSDYQDAGGAKIPFRWMLSRPNGQFTIQIKDVEANAAIDDAKFAKP